MKKSKLAQLCRWLCYFSWSYVWVGVMFLLMIHQVTPYLTVGLALALLFFVAARKLDVGAFNRRAHRGVRLLVMGAFVLLQFWCWRYFYFFRDPERAIPAVSAIVSPADGFVVYIRRVREGVVPLAIKSQTSIPLSEILKMGNLPPDSFIVGIFMTPMSVHVNRAPIAGVIGDRTYFRGTPMQSMLPMSLRTIFFWKPYERGSGHILQNERETLLIQGKFPVYLTRIADPYVDKIVTWKKSGETVSQGERIGLIKMGSQADLVFPVAVNGKAVQICVKEGQYVYAGSTILATFGQDSK